MIHKDLKSIQSTWKPVAVRRQIVNFQREVIVAITIVNRQSPRWLSLGLQVERAIPQAK